MDNAANAVAIYLKQCRESERFPYDEISNCNTVNFIWTAEKAGRFDLAEEIYELLSDSIVTLDTNPSCILNHGHVFLSQGNLLTAYRYYDESIRLAKNIEGNLKQDMHLFSRFGVIPDERLRQVCGHYDMDFTPTYTSHEEDSVLNSDCYQRLEGKWKWESDDQTTVILYIEANDRLLTYYVYDGTNIAYLSNANVRFEKRSGIIYWDEFCPDDDSNSFGKIIRIENGLFELEIIENGNPNAKGERRTYKKVE